MDSKKMSMGAVLFLAIAMVCATRAVAQSGCTNVLIGLAPCLNFVSGSSSTPSSQCCSQLASVVRSDPRCLCMVLNGGGASLGVTIDQKLALKLPGACNVQTPPVSRCNAGANNGPVGSPQSLPGDESAGSGSKSVPSTAGSSTSEGININTVLLSVVFVAASYAVTASSSF